VLVAPIWLGAQNNLCLPASNLFGGGMRLFRHPPHQDRQHPVLARVRSVRWIGLLNKPSMLFLAGAVMIGCC